MKGRFRNGQGIAHRYAWKHDAVFNCRMVGTFNVDLDGPIHASAPAKRQWRSGEGWYWYWLVRLNGHYGWAYKWEGSTLADNAVEILSKRPLSDTLKTDSIDVDVLEPWGNARRGAWAEKQHTHQTFSWWPSSRVDTQRKWLLVQGLEGGRLPGSTVLDIGSHYGYMAFQASRVGAAVTAVEPGDMERGCAATINDHIECQDVSFLASDPDGVFDYLFYLSVHHLRDPAYERLAETVAAYVSRARRAVFVEVILPPLFGSDLLKEDVDSAVGGVALDTYSHVIRGRRRIYRMEGKA